MFRSGSELSPCAASPVRPPILVIGGTGHVGASLCGYLAERGHQVIAASRFGGHDFDSARINWVEFDVKVVESAWLLPAATTAVICPWVDDVATGISDRWLERLLPRLASAGVTSVLYISTMWVYGARPEGRLTEESPTNPAAGYGVSHLENEMVVESMAGPLGLDTVIVRLANLVGGDPFFEYRNKISFGHELMTMAVANQSIVLRSPKSTPRDIITRSLFHHDCGVLLDCPKVPGRVEIFNLGSGQMTSMGEFAKAIATEAEKLHGRPVSLEFPRKTERRTKFLLDTAKVRALAGRHSLDLNFELERVRDDVVRRLNLGLEG